MQAELLRGKFGKGCAGDCGALPGIGLPSPLVEIV